MVIPIVGYKNVPSGMIEDEKVTVLDAELVSFKVVVVSYLTISSGVTMVSEFMKASFPVYEAETVHVPG